MKNRMHSILQRLNRAWSIFQLTRRHFRASRVRENCVYNINGLRRTCIGPSSLSMLLEIVSEDAYGLRQHSRLDSIVDVGANIGVFSLHARSLFPGALILSYEPHPTAYNLLTRNLAGLGIVTTQIAVAGGTGEAWLLPSIDPTASTVVKTMPAEATCSDVAQKVALISLEEVCARLKKAEPGRPSTVRLLKLDCEGSEYAILDSPAVRKFSIIVGELHTCEMGTPDAGLHTLQEKGFEIERWHVFPDGNAGIFWASNRRTQDVAAS